MVYNPDFGQDPGSGFDARFNLGGDSVGRTGSPNAGGGSVACPEGEMSMNVPGNWPGGARQVCVPVGAPPPPRGGGGGPGGVEPFNYQTPAYTGPARPQYNFPELPAFDAPEFTAPTFDEALNSPGYQFRLDQGRKALERSAAAKGVLRSGGTLSGILDYGQNAASQEYQNVFNRALDAFDRKYQGARDEFAPQLVGYQNRFAAEQRAGDLGFQRAWDEHIFGINDAFRREQMLYQGGLE